MCGDSKSEVTPEMIRAGVEVLEGDWGVIGNHAAEELAELVYRAKHFANSINAVSSSDGEETI